VCSSDLATAAIAGSLLIVIGPVEPSVGRLYIGRIFAIVILGGMGSIGGAMIGALAVGIARAAAVHLLPEIELFVIYAIMAAVLVFRPEGLFAPAKPRKI